VAILALVRYAEAARLPQFHLAWSIELFRAFPGMVRSLDVQEFRLELLNLVIDVILRRPEIITSYAIDGEKLFDYIDRPDVSIPNYDFLVPVRRVLARPLKTDAMLERARVLYKGVSQQTGILQTMYSTEFT
jgi:hypothetical protein